MRNEMGIWSESYILLDKKKYKIYSPADIEKLIGIIPFEKQEYVYWCSSCYHKRITNRDKKINFIAKKDNRSSDMSFKKYIRSSFTCGNCYEHFVFKKSFYEYINYSVYYNMLPKIDWSNFEGSPVVNTTILYRICYREYNYTWDESKLFIWLVNKIKPCPTTYSSNISTVILSSLSYYDIIKINIPQMDLPITHFCDACIGQLEKKGILTKKYYKFSSKKDKKNKQEILLHRIFATHY